MSLVIGNTSTTAGAGGAGLSWSHDSDGDLLVVGVSGSDGGAYTTTVTYNGVPMTQKIRKRTSASQGYAELFYLESPASGSNTVVVTFSEAVNDAVAGGVSISGYEAGDPVGASNSASGNSTAISTSVTTTADNSIVIDMAMQGGNTSMTIGASQTQRFFNSSAGSWINTGRCSTEPKVSAGAVTMSWTLGGSRDWAQVAMEIKESTASVGGGNFLGLLY